MPSVARLVSFGDTFPCNITVKSPQISRVCLIFPGYLAKMTKFQDFSRLEKLSPFFQVFQELWEPWPFLPQAKWSSLPPSAWCGWNQEVHPHQADSSKQQVVCRKNGSETHSSEIVATCHLV